jgi:hypothetical protein
MSGYERIGDVPDTFAVMVRWRKANESEAARLLHSLPFHAPEVIRRVLDNAALTGELKSIAEEVASKHQG